MNRLKIYTTEEGKFGDTGRNGEEKANETERRIPGQRLDEEERLRKEEDRVMNEDLQETKKKEKEVKTN